MDKKIDNTTPGERSNNKHSLKLTDLELIALVDVLDVFSSISDGFDDDGQAKASLRIVDKMLNKNGYRRQYS